MNHGIALHHLVLASTLATLAPGCILKIDDLDAGIDGETGDTPPDELDGVAECLVGTEPDALGVEQSSWDPGCGVVCADGWGHDGDQLEIAWTSSQAGGFIEDVRLSALGLLGNGRLVVAQLRPSGVFLTFLEPDGLNIGGYEVEGLQANVYWAEIASDVLYVTHGDGLGTIELTAVDIGGQQTLWTRTFPGHEVFRPARGGGRIAFTIRTDPELSEYELVALDLDGQTLWTTPTSDGAVGVGFSPSGARIGVAGATTRVYAAEDGALLDEFAHTALPSIFANTVAFADEDRIVNAGAGLEFDRFEGWLSSDSLVGGESWEHLYNRADAWCPHEDDNDWSAATAEFLGSIVRLGDGTLLVIGVEGFEEVPEEPEEYEGEDPFGSHPWAARFAADGEFLGSDRGLWDGGAIDVVAGPDGAAYVLSSDLSSGDEDSPGFRVRKYVFLH